MSIDAETAWDIIDGGELPTPLADVLKLLAVQAGVPRPERIPGTGRGVSFGEPRTVLGRIMKRQNAELAGKISVALEHLTFSQLRLANLDRDEDVWDDLKSWSPNDWAVALAGEVGELCNLLKKRHRGDVITFGELVNEVADIQIYLDLLAARLDIDLGAAVVHKFNKVSERVGSKVTL